MIGTQLIIFDRSVYSVGYFSMEKCQTPKMNVLCGSTNVDWFAIQFVYAGIKLIILLKWGFDKCIRCVNHQLRNAAWCLWVDKLLNIFPILGLRINHKWWSDSFHDWLDTTIPFYTGKHCWRIFRWLVWASILRINDDTHAHTCDKKIKISASCQ